MYPIARVHADTPMHVDHTHIDVPAHMHVFSVSMPRREYLHIQLCVLGKSERMILPAKTPTRHINSGCSKLSFLIIAIKLCVVFVHEL